MYIQWLDSAMKGYLLSCIHAGYWIDCFSTHSFLGFFQCSKHTNVEFSQEFYLVYLTIPWNSIFTYILKKNISLFTFVDVFTFAVHYTWCDQKYQSEVVHITFLVFQLDFMIKGSFCNSSIDIHKQNISNFQSIMMLPMWVMHILLYHTIA